MSKLVLFGTTALEYYAHVLSRPANAIALGATDDPSTLAALAPLASGTAHIGACFPHLTAPYHVTVFSERERRQKVARCHVAPRSLRAAPFFPIAHGIYAPSPELALLESSRGRAIPEVAYEGALLCGTFALSENGGAARPAPLATIKHLEQATRMYADVPGRKTLRAALPWIPPATASPREAALALALTLPTCWGGCGLPQPRINYRIDISARGKNLAQRRYYVADLCWPDRRIAVEYDSDEFHLSPHQHYLDTMKRTTLEEMGYRVITVTRQQLSAPSEFEKVAVVVAKALRRPLRIRTQDFHARQRALWRILRLSFAVSEPDERTFSSSPEIAHSPREPNQCFKTHLRRKMA